MCVVDFHAAFSQWFVFCHEAGCLWHCEARRHHAGVHPCVEMDVVASRTIGFYGGCWIGRCMVCLGGCGDELRKEIEGNEVP